MPKIEREKTERFSGTRYPAPFDAPCVGRQGERLGDVAGLTQFGVNLVRIPAGGWSSQRHAHSREDEFVYMLTGELVLVEDEGETLLQAGDCAGFKAGTGNGHHLQNRTEREASFLVVGTRVPGDAVDYPDIDMVLPAADTGGVRHYHRRDGTAY